VALRCGAPIASPALTLNRLCGSGFETVIQGAEVRLFVFSPPKLSSDATWLNHLSSMLLLANGTQKLLLLWINWLHQLVLMSYTYVVFECLQHLLALAQGSAARLPLSRQQAAAFKHSGWYQLHISWYA
jgi:hypothetical protein